MSNRELSAEERQNLFHERYGEGNDATTGLVELVRAAGDYLAQILGTDPADAGMATMLQPLISGDPPSAWRKQLDDESAYAFSKWPLGARLHDLAAYAGYGVVLRSYEDNPELIEDWLQRTVKDTVDFYDRSPIRQWDIDTACVAELDSVVMLAKNRWALDTGQPIEPAALAEFGGVSEGRIRNLMSQKDSGLDNVSGKIPAQQALNWLADRPQFFDSIWRTQAAPKEHSLSEPLNRPLFVPVARDGTAFHPGLARKKGFEIGPKGDERYVADFEEALIQLQTMPTPYWRRPNEKGVYGIVRGVQWERHDYDSLEARSISISPQDQ